MTSTFKKTPQLEIPCVFAIKSSAVYCFVVCNDSLPRLSLSQIESLRLAKNFRPEQAFQNELARSKQEALLFTASFSVGSIQDNSALQNIALLIGSRGTHAEVKLLPFAAAAKEMTLGDDRRILQMAVQYLAAGGVDDSLTAAEYDWDFIQKIKGDLENKN